MKQAAEINLKTEQIEHYLQKITQACAKFSEDGKLVIASFGQNPTTGKSYKPKIKHFKFDEKEEMLQFIEQLGEEQHRNIYMPLAIMKPDLSSGRKGQIDDVIAVLGLCADFDDENASQYLDRLPLEPDLVLETSEGRYQTPFLFDEPVIPDEASEIAELLQIYSGCDYGTKEISHVWRIPGTLNYPNKKKVDEGRKPDPQTVDLIYEKQGELTSFKKLDRRLRVWHDKEINTKPIRSEMVMQKDRNTTSMDIDNVDINPQIKQLIFDGKPCGERSEAIWSVMRSLISNDWSDEEIAKIILVNPIGEKAHEKSKPKEWLQKQIQKAREWLQEKKTKEEVIKEIDEILFHGTIGHKQWAELLYKAELNPADHEDVLNHLVSKNVGRKRPLQKEWEKWKSHFHTKKLQKKAEKQNKAIIRYSPLELNAAIRKVENALIYSGKSCNYFLYGDRLSLIVAEEMPKMTGTTKTGKLGKQKFLKIMPYNEYSLPLEIEERVTFISKDKKGNDKNIPVPVEITRTLLNNPNSKALKITGLINHPIMNWSGDIIEKGGYDQDSGLYLSNDISPKLLPSNQRCAFDDAKDAVEKIKNIVLPEFGWKDEDLDSVATISLFLTTLCRKMTDQAPGFIINSHIQGAGKTTLAKIAYAIVTAAELPVCSLSLKNIEDTRKEILAHLLGSPSMICFDNQPEGSEINNPILATILTNQSFEERILGTNQMARVPTNTCFMITGNNISVSQDLIRRFVSIHLDPKMANPESKVFKNPDILRSCLEQRAEILGCLLTIQKAFFDQNCQMDSENIKPSGFSQWDQMVRFPLLKATGVDVWDTMKRTKQDSIEYKYREVLLQSLTDFFHDIDFRAIDLRKLYESTKSEKISEQEKIFAESISALSSTDDPSSKSLGKILKSLVNVPFGDKTLKCTSSKKGNKYRVRIFENEELLKAA